MISWDFKQLTMKFKREEEEIGLKGISSNKLKVLPANPSQKLLSKAAHVCLLQGISKDSHNDSSHLVQVSDPETIPRELQLLKEKFACVFEEPSSLPPSRGVYDHRIPLEPGFGAVNIRPYRYPLK